jgi:DNA-binding winged helix-turn-helix (wHTH) protein/tetratricopeptide (TPR) repeat protein
MKESSGSDETQPDYRFGPFELSVARRTLYRDGVAVRIQELPFQALHLLVEEQGRVVSKSELQDRLWGRDTFVEVDPNLYVIIGKLRDLLGDDAVTPRFIKTVSGRGYQFIGMITRATQASAPDQGDPIRNDVSSIDALTASSLIPIEPLPAPFSVHGHLIQEIAPLTPSRPLQRRNWMRPWLWLLFGVVMAVSGIWIVWRNHTDHGGIYLPAQFVMIAGPDDSSQASRFDQMLPFLVKLKLQQSPYLALLPDRRIADFKRNEAYNGKDGEVRECSALGGSLLLNSQVVAIGQGYRIELAALRCPDGKVLTTQHADVDSEASLLSAVDLVTERMRQRLGEPASSLQRFDIPLMESTTTSLAALKEFTEGEEKLQTGNGLAAVSNFKMAVDLDPKFALAYARLGTIYLNSQQPATGSNYISKAFELRDKISDKERLYIAGHYYTDVTGDLQSAVKTYDLWTTLYPRDWGPFNNLANLYDLLGNPEKGVEYARAAAQMNPNSGLTTATLAQAYLELGDHPQLNTLCKDPSQTANAFITFHNICFLDAFARGDEPEMQGQLVWAKGNPQESLLLGSVASTDLAGGKLGLARQALVSARDNASRYHIPEIATMMDLDQGDADAEFGSPQQAVENVHEALTLAQHDIEAQAFAAMILAVAGQDRSAQRLAADTSKQAPGNDAIVSVGMPTVKV